MLSSLVCGLVRMDGKHTKGKTCACFRTCRLKHGAWIIAKIWHVGGYGVHTRADTGLIVSTVVQHLLLRITSCLFKNMLHDLCMSNLARSNRKVMKYEYACIVTKMMAELLGRSD